MVSRRGLFLRLVRGRLRVFSGDTNRIGIACRDALTKLGFTMTTLMSARPEGAVRRLTYKLAEPSDFDAIHRLNYETFVEEIPQHAPNPERRLVDRFHTGNTYVVCFADERLIGMVCGRCERPFSLDRKVAEMDAGRKSTQADLERLHADLTAKGQ